MGHPGLNSIVFFSFFSRFFGALNTKITSESFCETNKIVIVLVNAIVFNVFNGMDNDV